VGGSYLEKEKEKTEEELLKEKKLQETKKRVSRGECEVVSSLTLIIATGV